MAKKITIKEIEKQRNSNQLKVEIAELSPAYFAFVMATGIVSIAAFLYKFILISKALFYINTISYIIICALFLVRFIYYKKEFLSDFTDDRKNMGFLTFVAASCILGSQFVLIENNYRIGIIFLTIGLLSWLFLMYLLFAIIIEKRENPALDSINGLWLLPVVATQSVSILSAQLEEFLPFSSHEVLFFSMILFLCGCMFYIILITLIFYRLIFFKMEIQDFSSSYWINMGADAITVLAGSTLILKVDKWEFLSEILPFLKGFTLLFWAIGTWWIPLMVILGIFRHIIKKVPFKYNPEYWGMVFPLGMYTVCTLKLSEAVDLPFLMGISSVFVFFAIAAWTIVFLSLVYFLASNFRSKSTF